ncbi:MAG TPA: NAD(P)H-binding protein [Gemmatimonadales bacterium]|nr:NAD(P)H-binding protein [Gemmatimonadales bacterium]
MNVFVTGGTGYIGQRLVPALLARGHRVRVLARQTSLHRVPAGAVPVVGDALRESTFASAVRPGETVVHLVGTPHPSPAKAAEFERVDLASVVAASSAAERAGVLHFVYVSVAHPAPTMRAYIAVREKGEQRLASAGLTRTILRPWYVLGPGHWWPAALLPLYGIARLLPPFWTGAERLGLVTLSQMVRALVAAVEQPPPAGTARILDVPAIRAALVSEAAAKAKRSPVGVP